MLHIFRTKKPIDLEEEPTPPLVGRTTDLDEAFDIADRTNRSELKNLNKKDWRINGNREVTEIFTTEELQKAGWGESNGDIPE